MIPIYWEQFTYNGDVRVETGYDRATLDTVYHKYGITLFSSPFLLSPSLLLIFFLLCFFLSPSLFFSPNLFVIYLVHTFPAHLRRPQDLFAGYKYIHQYPPRRMTNVLRMSSTPLHDKVLMVIKYLAQVMNEINWNDRLRISFFFLRSFSFFFFFLLSSFFFFLSSFFFLLFSFFFFFLLFSFFFLSSFFLSTFSSTFWLFIF
jgi:hypothetical protein